LADNAVLAEAAADVGVCAADEDAALGEAADSSTGPFLANFVIAAASTVARRWVKGANELEKRDLNESSAAAAGDVAGTTPLAAEEGVVA